MAWGLALTVGAMVLRELVRPRAGQARLIDWERVEQAALRRCGEPKDTPLEAGLPARYEAIEAELTPLLDDALGRPTAATGSPGLTPVGRRDWVRFNLRIFRQMLRPLESLQQHLPDSLLVDLGQQGMTRYLGLMLGLLARRVLGQYDPALLGRELPETSTLILVEPNVVAWAARDHLPLDELRRWLAMHEMTHAWEFRAHPWLRDHLESLLREVLVGRLQDGHRPTSWEVIRTVTVGVGQQWKAIARLQAVMSLLEGYSNLVMDDVGRRQLPHFALLERAYHRRLEQRTPLERAFLRLTGLEMKIKQYVQGERFCAEVRQAGGADLLGRVWQGPQWLPSLAEIRRPGLWISRVEKAA